MLATLYLLKARVVKLIQSLNTCHVTPAKTPELQVSQSSLAEGGRHRRKEKEEQAQETLAFRGLRQDGEFRGVLVLHSGGPGTDMMV